MVVIASIRGFHVEDPKTATRVVMANDERLATVKTPRYSESPIQPPSPIPTAPNKLNRSQQCEVARYEQHTVAVIPMASSIRRFIGSPIFSRTGDESADSWQLFSS